MPTIFQRDKLAGAGAILGGWVGRKGEQGHGSFPPAPCGASRKRTIHVKSTASGAVYQVRTHPERSQRWPQQLRGKIK